MAEKTPRKAPPKRPSKKTWQTPRLKSGQLFESNSLACGKNFNDPNEGGDLCGQQAPQRS